MLFPSQAVLAQLATGYGARQDPLTIPETLGGAEAVDHVLLANAAKQLSARATCETLRLHFHFKETRLAKRRWEKTGWHQAAVTALPPCHPLCWGALAQLCFGLGKTSGAVTAQKQPPHGRHQGGGGCHSLCPLT